MKNTEPYIAVIFTSVRSDDQEGFSDMDKRTFEEVERSPGYLGAESYSADGGRHVTIAYFRSEEDVATWKSNTLHLEAQELGRKRWYKEYRIRICRVERDYEFNK